MDVYGFDQGFLVAACLSRLDLYRVSQISGSIVIMIIDSEFKQLPQYQQIDCTHIIIN